MLTRMSRRTTTRFRENNCLKLFGLMLRQFLSVWVHKRKLAGALPSSALPLILVKSLLRHWIQIFSAVHAATEHQFECGDELTGDLGNGPEAAQTPPLRPPNVME
jgi:hypothetical protein